MDKIILKGLPVGCVIGTLPAERTAPQTLFFDLELCGDFSSAGRTDDLNDAVDYTAVERCVKDLRGFAKTKLLNAQNPQTGRSGGIGLRRTGSHAQPFLKKTTFPI